MKRIQVIIAHLDDEIYGLGGTIIKLNEKNKIFITVLCQGAEWDSLKELQERQLTFMNFCNDLGIEYNIHKYVDTFLDKVPQTRIIEEILKDVNAFDPHIIFTHSKDQHKDHCIVSDCVDVVSRPTRRENLEKIYHFEIPGNSELSISSKFSPNTYIEIDERKYYYIQKYKLYPENDPLNIEKIKAKDRYFGSMIKKDLAERFQLVFSKGI